MRSVCGRRLGGRRSSWNAEIFLRICIRCIQHTSRTLLVPTTKFTNLIWKIWSLLTVLPRQYHYFTSSISIFISHFLWSLPGTRRNALCCTKMVAARGTAAHIMAARRVANLKHGGALWGGAFSSMLPTSRSSWRPNRPGISPLRLCLSSVRIIGCVLLVLRHCHHLLVRKATDLPKCADENSQSLWCI